MKYEKRVVCVLERRMSRPDLAKAARSLASVYSANLSDSEVWRLVFAVMPDALCEYVERWSHVYVGHEFVNALIMRYDSGEATVKYHLTRSYLRESDGVSLYEFVVDSNRLDYGRINGSSYAYEIKTELDTVARLAAQIQAYSRVFEHVAVVVDERHISFCQTHLPECCGIQVYTLQEGDCEFTTIRESRRSEAIDPDAQIRNLSVRDLAYIIRAAGLSAPRHRRDQVSLIGHELSCADMNEMFKCAVRHKYAESWSHVRRNFDRIQPVDLQAFYHGKWDPEWVYYKSSTMV